MSRDETWVAEQARLIDLEDGFGPGYLPTRSGDTAENPEDLAARPAA